MAELWEKIKGFRYVLLVAVAGLILILWPARSSAQSDPTEEERIAAVLMRIEGVGQTEVLLSDNGAVVVCRGADDAAVRLGVSMAVRCYTGLGADKVEIYKMD